MVVAHFRWFWVVLRSRSIFVAKVSWLPSSFMTTRVHGESSFSASKRLHAKSSNASYDAVGKNMPALIPLCQVLLTKIIQLTCFPV